MRGTRNNFINSLDHEFIVYEINRCHESLRDTTPLDKSCDPNIEECEPVDPPCASKEEID